MSRYTLEICCASVDDVLEAARAGADRVELNSCLFQGGLTPSVGELIVAKRVTDIPIMTMVRPRQGGFHYTDTEYLTAIADAEQLLAHGADGLVFGFLNEDGTLDDTRTKEFVRLAGNKTKVFHRAIDVAPDWKEMLARLIDLGVDRVLTSGQAPDAFYGSDVIREMIEFADGRIEILPGGGIKLRNLERVLERTGCTQIHMGPHRSVKDMSTSFNREIHFGGALYPPEELYGIVDTDYVRAVRDKL